jgi:sialic acid synthase SpsE
VVDFVHLEELRQICGNSYSYGYSDHSTDALIIPRKAKFHGATVIEKHVNFIDGMASDDVAHSLDMWAFGLMVRSLRDEPISPRETVSFVTRTSYLRRPYATRTIHAEEPLVVGDNVKFYRGYDAAGMPFDLTRRKYVANQLIEKGDLITFGKVSE